MGTKKHAWLHTRHPYSTRAYVPAVAVERCALVFKSAVLLILMRADLDVPPLASLIVPCLLSLASFDKKMVVSHISVFLP